MPYLGNTDHQVGNVAAYCANTGELLAGSKPQIHAELLLAETSELEANVIEAPSQSSTRALDNDRTALCLQLH